MSTDIRGGKGHYHVGEVFVLDTGLDTSLQDALSAEKAGNLGGACHNGGSTSGELTIGLSDTHSRLD